MLSYWNFSSLANCDTSSTACAWASEGRGSPGFWNF